MNTALIYYSYSGHTQKLARKIAAEHQLPLIEIKDANRPSKPKAYILGCLAALRRKSWPIAPFDENLSSFQRFIVMGPVWAGYPAPQVNQLLDVLPSGSEIEVVMVSGSGHSQSEPAVRQRAEQRGLQLCAYHDTKTP